MRKYQKRINSSLLAIAEGRKLPPFQNLTEGHCLPLEEELVSWSAECSCIGTTQQLGKGTDLGICEVFFQSDFNFLFCFCFHFQGRGTKHYGLIVVGHSLGAGTAAILSFLLRPQYPSLKCFAYSPPGGLLR